MRTCFEPYSWDLVYISHIQTQCSFRQVAIKEAYYSIQPSLCDALRRIIRGMNIEIGAHGGTVVPSSIVRPNKEGRPSTMIQHKWKKKGKFPLWSKAKLKINAYFIFSSLLLLDFSFSLCFLFEALIIMKEYFSCPKYI